MELTEQLVVVVHLCRVRRTHTPRLHVGDKEGRRLNSASISHVVPRGSGVWKNDRIVLTVVEGHKSKLTAHVDLPSISYKCYKSNAVQSSHAAML